MLQRIQTIFLFLAAIFMGLFLLFPIWVYENTEIHRLHAYGLFSQNNGGEGMIHFWPYSSAGALGLAVVLVSLISIFSYRKRTIQMKLGALNSLLLAAALVTAVWFATDVRNDLTIDGPGVFGMSLFFPVLAMICNFLANRFIRKDEDLVRSMDRLR